MSRKYWGQKTYASHPLFVLQSLLYISKWKTPVFGNFPYIRNQFSSSGTGYEVGTSSTFSDGPRFLAYLFPALCWSLVGICIDLLLHIHQSVYILPQGYDGFHWDALGQLHRIGIPDFGLG